MPFARRSWRHELRPGWRYGWGRRRGWRRRQLDGIGRNELRQHEHYGPNRKRGNGTHDGQSSLCSPNAERAPLRERPKRVFCKNLRCSRPPLSREAVIERGCEDEQAELPSLASWPGERAFVTHHLGTLDDFLQTPSSDHPIPSRYGTHGHRPIASRWLGETFCRRSHSHRVPEQASAPPVAVRRARRLGRRLQRVQRGASQLRPELHPPGRDRPQQSEATAVLRRKKQARRKHALSQILLGYGVAETDKIARPKQEPPTLLAFRTLCWHSNRLRYHVLRCMAR